MVAPTAGLLLLLWSCLAGSLSVQALDKRDTSSSCSQIASSISSASSVYYPGAPQWMEDIEHFSSSSTQQATCSVEPGTPQDVAVVLRILGSTNTTFAVKGGGHTSNPTFSSTTGVQISMTRFSGVTYNAGTSTVDVGSGLLWDDVYSALAPYNVTVVGGRVSGIGVAGFTLGGGYSFLTSQYGLTLDTVTGFELVTPTGAILEVTQSSYPDLMFALKGIVTRFTLQTYPIGEVWGGIIVYPASSMTAVSSAIGNYTANVRDPKAALLAAYNYAASQVIGSLTFFYDGPTPPDGIFDEFLAIPALEKDVSSRSWLSLFRYWGAQLALQSAELVSYDIEPFLPSLYSHGSTSTSAWPPIRAVPYLPMNIYYAWASSYSDNDFYEAAQQSVATVKAAAIAMGQNVESSFVYGNYAIFSTPITQIFGDQLPRLEAIRASVDPHNVMALTGGWRIPY
ncbi:FAD-binding domain-containing protein [Gloeophyllum trabeum ATCC 11539]|uniref:FAD-binding domain-containing protein n=1 Tax=Gloeophyllum trabeum (strain ATCC 11539 / FP-39264 / Madison 617) TaxID=670483 RepID=S7QMQ0_GLOTA|nr:FAD-binding domain-containing protein [Gloeophyllum trabeum ATCC 11539]EPQ60851.1 FAD-binding domain-containing protein [Gloeophyllum trabeum ATCC 11539]